MTRSLLAALALCAGCAVQRPRLPALRPVLDTAAAEARMRAVAKRLCAPNDTTLKSPLIKQLACGDTMRVHP